MVKVKVAETSAHESDKNDDKIYFMALGGLEHVGQNMYVYKYKGKYLIVDCGMGFLEEEIGAGDVQYCDTTWLEKHKKDVKKYYLTESIFCGFTQILCNRKELADILKNGHSLRT